MMTLMMELHTRHVSKNRCIPDVFSRSHTVDRGSDGYTLLHPALMSASRPPSYPINRFFSYLRLFSVAAAPIFSIMIWDRVSISRPYPVACDRREICYRALSFSVSCRVSQPLNPIAYFLYPLPAPCFKQQITISLLS